VLQHLPTPDCQRRRAPPLSRDIVLPALFDPADVSPSVSVVCAVLIRGAGCSTINRDHLGEEGGTGRPTRSCVTRFGTRGPGSQADQNAKTNRHGSRAGDDGASNRHRPSSLKGGDRCAGTRATSWRGFALPNTYDVDSFLQCMTLSNLD